MKKVQFFITDSSEDRLSNPAPYDSALAIQSTCVYLTIILNKVLLSSQIAAKLWQSLEPPARSADLWLVPFGMKFANTATSLLSNEYFAFLRRRNRLVIPPIATRSQEFGAEVLTQLKIICERETLVMLFFNGMLYLLRNENCYSLLVLSNAYGVSAPSFHVTYTKSISRKPSHRSTGSKQKKASETSEWSFKQRGHKYVETSTPSRCDQ